MVLSRRFNGEPTFRQLPDVVMFVTNDGVAWELDMSTGQCSPVVSDAEMSEGEVERVLEDTGERLDAAPESNRTEVRSICFFRAALGNVPV